jgi:hypothetical protein
VLQQRKHFIRCALYEGDILPKNFCFSTYVAEGFCVTAAGLLEASRFPARRMRMDEVEFHREPPSNLPTLVTAFGGWIDAGEAATGAMRYLVRQLAAVPLASIDPEDFVDFTQVRPVVMKWTRPCADRRQ